MDDRSAQLFSELDRISRARARWLASVLAAGFAGGAAAILLACHIADLALILTPAARQILGPAIVAVLAAGGLAAIGSLFIRKSPAATAAWLEGREMDFRQDLSTVAQCAGRADYSAELVSELAGRSLERLRGVRPAAGARKFTVRLRAASASLFILLVLTCIIWPGAARISLARLARPWGVIGDWSRVDVVPGDVRIPAGEELLVEVRSGAGKARVIVESAERAVTACPMALRDGSLKALLPPAERDFQYRFFPGRMQSRSFRVAVYRPLVLEGISVRIEPPAYTRLAPVEMPNQGGIEAVKGSRASVTARASRPAGSAAAIFSGGQAVAGTTAGGEISFSLSVQRDDRYRLMAVSPGGADTFVSAEYQITAVSDLPPEAELYGDDLPEVPRGEMAALVAGRARDDFGLSRLRIGYLLQGQPGHREIAAPGRTVTDTSVEFAWSLANMGLLPGDSLVYWLEAVDNDAVSGPKTGRSRSRKLWVPSIAELYQAMARQDSAATAELAGIQPEQAQIREQIQRLSRAVKESRRVDWQQQAAIEKALEDQQELLSRLERAADQALESLRPEGRQIEIDAETASKLRELRQLFDQVATDEMRRAMERLSKAMEKMDRQEVARALEKMNLTAEELKHRLDQAIAALKELQQQKQMDRIKEELDRLAEEQRDIRDRTGAAGEQTEADRLARRQQQAAEDLEALAREARQLGEQMESQPEAGEKLRQSGDRMQKKGTPAKMRQAGQRISQGKKQAAMDLQQQALQEMAELSQGLESARSSMAQARSRARAQALRQKAREALSLSQQQEDLNRMMREGGDANDLAERQQTLARAGARLQSRAGSRQEMMMPPQAAGSLSRAVRAMGQSGQEIMGGRRGQAGQQGQEAVAALNQAAAAMLEASSQSSGSQGGGDMMQELEGLSGQQSDINQQTLGLMPSAGGRPEALSQEARSQMARLAAQQEAVRQGMDEYNRKYADRRDRADRLDDLAGEMQKAAEDLRQQRADDRTRERQERILNRLLQAQRSLRDQDFSRQRKAEPGRDQGQAAGRGELKPGEAPPPPSDRDWRNEPYPLEYREIIERYFRSLGW